jgi:hypothetical protein
MSYKDTNIITDKIILFTAGINHKILLHLLLDINIMITKLSFDIEWYVFL